MSQSDTDSLDYLQTGFDPSSLTVPRLRSILVSHNISYPSSAKKPQLIEIFTEHVLPQSHKIISARARARRTSKGITDADSQDSTVGDEELMPPPPTPRRIRKPSAKLRVDESDSDLPTLRSPAKKTPRASSKHARADESETGTDDGMARSVRKSRKSEAPTPVPARIKLEEELNRRESAFTYDNPFQSGSSPPTGRRSSSGESKRKSLGVSSSKDLAKRKSSTTRRRTETPVAKAEDGIHPPTSATFEIPVSELNGLKDYDENGVEASEEFTPEAQMELVRERSVNGVNALGPRRPKRQSPGLSISGPIWVVLLTLLGGYATWYRQEKIAVGYCGVGRDARQIIPAGVEVPEWAKLLAEPQCEPCPQHAYCSGNLETHCEADFVLKPHPLSAGGLVPLPPTCEPDGEKVRRVKAVADRAVEELRERRAKWECGNLVDEAGVPQPAVEIDVEDLKKEVSKKRRKGMGQAEFEELWVGAIGEIEGREEVHSGVDGDHKLLTSISLARLPLSCAAKRTIRLALARHRLQITSLILVVFSILYTRHLLISRAVTSAAIPHLVSLTLNALVRQASLHVQDRDNYPESWISIGQLRDDVLRDEHSIKKREYVWNKVKKVVEMNANIRASQREGRNGEISRVWEWIGAVAQIEDGNMNRRKSRAASALETLPIPTTPQARSRSEEMSPHPRHTTNINPGIDTKAPPPTLDNEPVGTQMEMEMEMEMQLRSCSENTGAGGGATDMVHSSTLWHPRMNRFRVLASCLTALGMGLNDSAPGALLNYIEKDYHIGYAVVSMIFVANAFGFISAAFFTNALVLRLGRAKTLVIALGLWLAGYVCIVASPPFPVVVVGFFLTGVGMANALAIGQVFTATIAPGALITGFYQGSYGIGGTIGPLIATSLVSHGVHWSHFYLIPVGLAVFNLLLNGWSFWNFEKELTPEEEASMTQTRTNESASVKTRWKSFRDIITFKPVALGAPFIFAYQGSEVAISGWVIAFLVSYRGGDPAKVGYVTSGFWAGITLGRFTLSHLGSRIGERNFVFAIVLGALVLEVLVWSIPSVIGDSIAVALAGFLLGPIYPAATQVFVKLIPRNSHVEAFAVVASIGSSGGAFVPFMTGLLAQVVGTWVLHPICIGLFVVMLILWWLLPRTSKREE
ncbi:hypothetical protein B7494_g2446 [Chlorociboria aeruginascens]|nr:hypothetical protein B7494_g2446 [Chlorociboria aeruginascens]